MKYCIIDGMVLADECLCVRDDERLEDGDCSVLEELKASGKTHHDCEYYVEEPTEKKES